MISIKRLSIRSYVGIATVALLTLTVPSSVDAGLLQYTTISPDTIVGRQLFEIAAAGEMNDCCYDAEVSSFYWSSDTLYVSIYTSGFGMMQMLSWVGTSVQVSAEGSGVYHLEISEEYSFFLGGPVLSYGHLSDVFTVLPCPPCVAGDVDHDNEITISDVTFLVGYMFKSGFPPPCEAESDTNGDGSEDISDLTRLVNYMFKDGAAPVCP